MMLNFETVKTISAQLNEPNWLFEKRIKCFEQYKRLKMPEFKYNNGVYVDAPYTDFSEISSFNTETNNMIQVPDGIEIISLNEKINEHNDLVKEFFMPEGDTAIEKKILALHRAFFNSSFIINIPENFNSEKPIHLNLNLNSTRIENILIVAAKNSKVKIIENSKSENNKEIFRSHLVKIVARERSNVEYISLQNLGRKTNNFCNRYAQVGYGAVVYWVDCNIGGNFTQDFTSTFLEENEAEGKSLDIIFGESNQCFDVHRSIIHLVSNTKSDIYSRAVLNNDSKNVCIGMIEIRPNASKCEGYQKSDIVLLGDNSVANIIPNLKINNNDVKCSHGVTISQIDKDKLFYMLSRGLLESVAIKMIVMGFFDPIFERIQDENIKNQMINSILERLMGIKC